MLDIDDTVKELLCSFAKEICDKPNHKNATIDEYKWKLLCMFAATTNGHHVATSLENLPLVTNMDARK